MVHERAESTRQLLIAATATRLADSDESELRIADVCEDTGLSSSVIYSNFRSRQGLIDATFLSMYEERALRYVALLRQNTAQADSMASLLSFYRTGESDDQVHEALKDFRRIRLRVSTAALARPEMQRSFILVQEAFLTQMTLLIEDVQARGLFGRRLTGRQLAILLEGYSFARALNDISLHPETEESWMQILLLLLENL
jgi:AcrR family transcriptional regulator